MESVAQAVVPRTKSLYSFIASLKPRNFLVESYEVLTQERQFGARSKVNSPSAEKTDTRYRFVLDDELQELSRQVILKYRLSVISVRLESFRSLGIFVFDACWTTSKTLRPIVLLLWLVV